METETTNIIKSCVRIGWLIVCLIVLSMLGCPQYNVYQQRKEGEARLAEAESSRQIKQLEATATMNSAKDLAQADTIRAHGVARSNKIIGASLKNNKEYLHWLWIDNLNNNPNSVVYIPTEANLPILEAGKDRNKKDTTKTN